MTDKNKLRKKFLSLRKKKYFKISNSTQNKGFLEIKRRDDFSVLFYNGQENLYWKLTDIGE